jgi:hypothetical protein
MGRLLRWISFSSVKVGSPFVHMASIAQSPRYHLASHRDIPQRPG